MVVVRVFTLFMKGEAQTADHYVADVWLGFRISIKIWIFNLLLGGPWMPPGMPAWGWKYFPRP